jgi:penicillin-insensitive murein endopeptidase
LHKIIGHITHNLKAAGDAFLVIAEDILRNPFALVPSPQPGQPRIIGGYVAGCIFGAVELPPSGPGYEVMKLSRNRRYGHPELVTLVERAGRELGSRSPLLIGDMSLPDGGPMPFGHTSHQVGLDVDIWFYTPAEFPLREREREDLSMQTVLKAGYRELDGERWRQAYADDVMWFAGSIRVDRIFVNAVIKKELCREYPNDPRLIKVRPWYGHDDHFHVRLKCPADQPECSSQPPPVGAGCEESALQSWLSDKTLAWFAEPKGISHRTVRVPNACRPVVASESR